MTNYINEILDLLEGQTPREKYNSLIGIRNRNVNMSQALQIWANADLLSMKNETEILNTTKRGLSISRKWAMPSRHTFLIAPIAQLVHKYVGDGKGWVDPFAGENSPAEFTNDLNPNKPAKFHLHAKDFCQSLTGIYKGVLFDPPYSLSQVKECYNEIGAELFLDDANKFPQNVKEIIASKIEHAGIAITFGWNSQGFGKNLGFEKLEILLVPHGRSHNDTIVTVERKFTNSLFQ